MINFSRWTWVSWYQSVSILDSIGAKDDGGGGGDNWSYKMCKATKLGLNHHHQQTNTQIFYRLDAVPVDQPTVSKH